MDANANGMSTSGARLLACDFAERVAHLGDEAVLRGVIAVARRYANGEATDEELTAARNIAIQIGGIGLDSGEAAAWAAAWAAAADAGAAARKAALWATASAVNGEA